MPRWMVGLAIAGAVGCAIVFGGRAAAGFLLGAGLGILGFHWLHEMAVALLDAGAVRRPRSLVAKLFLRYLLMAAVIFFAQRTGWLPVLAVFAGLLVPGAGILAESLNLVRAGLKTES
jgi:hypothetical protein